MKFEVTSGGTEFQIELACDAEHASGWRCRVNGEELALDAVAAGDDVLSLLIDGRAYEVKRDRSAQSGRDGQGEQMVIGGTRYQTEVRDPRSLRSRKAREGGHDGPKKIIAPMPGKIVRVIAPAGTEVKAGQGVIVVEAMKMQNELKSPKDGRVQKIAAAEGAAVNAGDVLAVIE
jgi:biotin carboxyl carrier protein